MEAYEVPTYVFDMVLDELDMEKWVIWDPFPNTGHSTEHMRSKGFEVIVKGNYDSFFDHQEIPLASFRRFEPTYLSPRTMSISEFHNA